MQRLGFIIAKSPLLVESDMSASRNMGLLLRHNQELNCLTVIKSRLFPVIGTAIYYV